MALNNLQETFVTSYNIEIAINKKPLVSAENLLQSDSDLSKTLQLIEEELSKILGPVANIIFEDTLNKWSTRAIPTHETLSVLVYFL